MENLKIHPIRFGMANGYITIWEDRVVLIDTGLQGKTDLIEQALTAIGKTFRDICLIVLTHTHYDHAGTAAECKVLSGAPIAVQVAEAPILRSGESRFPGGATGLGRFLIGGVQKLGIGTKPFSPVEPDILVEDELDLHPYGFPGVAIHTPGHSPGSISLLAEDGSCFPGDILFNIFPRSVFPPFADNPELLKEQWQILLQRGAERFYPGHGRPFGREKIEGELAEPRGT